MTFDRTTFVVNGAKVSKDKVGPAAADNLPTRPGDHRPQRWCRSAVVFASAAWLGACGPSQQEQAAARQAERLAEGKAVLDVEGAALAASLAKFVDVHRQAKDKPPLAERTGFEAGLPVLVFAPGADKNAQVVQLEGKVSGSPPPLHPEIAHWDLCRPGLVHLPKLRAQVGSGVVEDWTVNSIRTDLAELEAIEYLVVHHGKSASPKLNADSKTFAPGVYLGTAYVFEMKGATYLGGFPIAAKSSGVVTGKTSELGSEIFRDLTGQIEVAIAEGLSAGADR